MTKRKLKKQTKKAIKNDFLAPMGFFVKTQTIIISTTKKPKPKVVYKGRQKNAIYKVLNA